MVLLAGREHRWRCGREERREAAPRRHTAASTLQRCPRCEATLPAATADLPPPALRARAGWLLAKLGVALTSVFVVLTTTIAVRACCQVTLSEPGVGLLGFPRYTLRRPFSSPLKADPSHAASPPGCGGWVLQVGFTLRETQLRMLKFTLQLQQASRNRVPTRRLIAAHIGESLVFVPIMLGAPPAPLPPLRRSAVLPPLATRGSRRRAVSHQPPPNLPPRLCHPGVLFFLFEFFSDQILAFLLLALVWTCELLVSVLSCIAVSPSPRSSQPPHPPARGESLLRSSQPSADRCP